MKTHADLYRELPSVDELLHDPTVSGLAELEGQAPVADASRAVLARLRTEIAAGHLDENKLALALSGLPSAVHTEVNHALGYSLRPVINATGVILHTNLGRAPLAHNTIEHIQNTVAVYSNLEFDIESGERGKRDVHVDRLFRKLLTDNPGGTGALGRTPQQAICTIVVNNNAAAVLLALNTL